MIDALDCSIQCFINWPLRMTLIHYIFWTNVSFFALLSIPQGMFASQMPTDFQVWKSVFHICVMKSVGHKSLKMGIWWIWTPPELVIYAVLQIPWAEENVPLGIRVGWYFLKWSSSHVWVLLEPCRSHLLAIHLEKSSIGKQRPTFVSWDPHEIHVDFMRHESLLADPNPPSPWIGETCP